MNGCEKVGVLVCCLMLAVASSFGLYKDRLRKKSVVTEIRFENELYRTSRGRCVDFEYVKKNCIIDSSGLFVMYIDTSGHGEMARAANEVARLSLEIENSAEDKEIEREAKIHVRSVVMAKEILNSAKADSD